MFDHLGKLARESHSNCANQQALNLDTACAHLNENLLEFGEVFNKFTCLNNKKQTFEKLTQILRISSCKTIVRIRVMSFVI